ncbi:MAG: hypothetical protein HYT08_05290 [Candidatus Levybacteria bacterium]|nr:hypothetical protein [Candidatus Levybacteria bacterium]
MSVESLIGRKYSQILEAQSYVNEKVRREKELGHTRSHIYIVSSVFIDKGRKELKEISEKLNKSGIRINPISHIPLFRQVPKTERKKAGLAYAALTFGVVMISAKQLVDDKIFRPSEMVGLFNYSVDGTFIPKWNSNGLGDIAIPKPQQLLLNNFAHDDPSLSFIFTKGWEQLPEQLRRVIENVGLVPLATTVLIPPYSRLVRKQIRETRGR